jgi:hypothetical protein
LLTVPNSSGHIPDQQVSRNRYESGGGSKSRSRSRSGGGGKGQRPRRKQSLASTIFNMIINPAPTSRSHHQRIGFSQRQQRSFDIISSSSSSSVQQQQQHQLQLSPPDSGNNSLVSLATTERQCKHQYQMRQQHSYAGETEEVMVLTETERSSSRDGEPSSYCFLGGGRRMQKKHSASRPAADKLAPVAQTDSTRRRGLPRWMVCQIYLIKLKINLLNVDAYF